jgi:hypothetical protein
VAFDNEFDLKLIGDDDTENVELKTTDNLVFEEDGGRLVTFQVSIAAYGTHN